MVNLYTVFHPLVVDVACDLFWTQSVSMVQKQNTRNIYNKRMKDGVVSSKILKSVEVIPL